MSSLVSILRKRKSLQTILLLSPSLVVIFVFLLIPMVIVFAYSFASRDTYGRVITGFTLENYKSLFQALYIPIFLNSFKLAFYTTVISLALAYPVAYFIAFRAKRYASTLLLLIIIPFWTNFMVRMSAWVVLLNRNGLINEMLQFLKLTDEPVKLLGTYGAVLVGLLYAFLPSAVFPIYASLESIDQSLLEAARDLGASPLRAFLTITLPLSLPGLIAAILFVFVPSIGVFVVPAILGGGKNILIGNLIVMLYLEFRNIPFGSAVSVVLLFFVMIGIAVYMRTLRAAERMRQ
jgi:spermidine/putrescine transport system permease protein